MCHFKEIKNRCTNIIFSLGGGPNFLFGRTSFTGILNVVLSEPPFRDQPYSWERIRWLLYWMQAGRFPSVSTASSRHAWIVFQCFHIFHFYNNFDSFNLFSIFHFSIFVQHCSIYFHNFLDTYIFSICFHIFLYNVYIIIYIYIYVS